MASLVKNGKSYGLIWTVDGKQTRESLKTGDPDVAARRKARLEHEFWEGLHDPFQKKWYERQKEKGMMLGRAVEQFITYKTRSRGRDGWSPENAKKETFVMRNFVRVIGDKPLKNLSEADLERLYYRDTVTSDHTRNSDYISMNTFLNWCLDRGYLDTKPEYKPKKPQTKIPKFIYPEELAGLIQWKLHDIEYNIAHNNVYREEHGSYWMILGWMILAGTGLRPVELANLRLQHVERGTLHIGEDFTTKVRAERRVPLLFESREAVDLLTNPHFRSLDPLMRRSDYLLGRKPSHSKKKLSRAFSQAWKKRYPSKAKRTLYNLKDFFCVRFLTDDSVPSHSGMKLNDLREILGHASLETTQRYLKAIPFGTSVRGTIWDVDTLAVLADLAEHLERHGH